MHGDLRRTEDDVGGCGICHPHRYRSDDSIGQSAKDCIGSSIPHASMYDKGLAAKWMPRVVNGYRANAVCTM